MWGHYGQYMAIVERQRSEASDNNMDKNISMPYVFNDITTFFTLLVGIYFPSVTGIVYNKKKEKEIEIENVNVFYLLTFARHSKPL